MIRRRLFQSCDPSSRQAKGNPAFGYNIGLRLASLGFKFFH